MLTVLFSRVTKFDIIIDDRKTISGSWSTSAERDIDQSARRTVPCPKNVPAGRHALTLTSSTHRLLISISPNFRKKYFSFLARLIWNRLPLAVHGYLYGLQSFNFTRHVHSVVWYMKLDLSTFAITVRWILLSFSCWNYSLGNIVKLPYLQLWLWL